MPTSTAAFIAANRFGLGAAPGQLAQINADPRGWLMEQISRRDQSASDYGLPDAATLTERALKIRKELAQNKKAADAEDTDRQERKGLARDLREDVSAALRARFLQNITGAQPFLERLALFWSNHFTVALAGKPFLMPLAVAYERDAIRPHVFGRFEDMLLEGTRHPAMLLYLDNATSIGPNSSAGQRRGKGLNENLARETLELHSLGVDGGYTQADVIALAKIITGWTIAARREGRLAQFIETDGLKDGFAYVDAMHEPGAQTLMGRVYAQEGRAQGEAALRDLAAHPSTAKYVALKLARHFIADAPPAADVEKLAAAYRNSNGDLAEVSKTLISLDSVWASPLPKVKTPYELVLSGLRAASVPAEKVKYPKIQASLKTLDQPPFGAKSPAGWGDRADDWISGHALMNRIEWCHAVAAQIPIPQNPADVAQDVLGPVLGADTLTSIRRAPSAVDGLALLLASAEFQRR